MQGALSKYENLILLLCTRLIYSAISSGVISFIKNDGLPWPTTEKLPTPYKSLTGNLANSSIKVKSQFVATVN
jgi:hypothetical protein